jgi:hypothetical protein
MTREHLRRGGHGRVGQLERQVRRALRGYEQATTRLLAEHCLPRLDWSRTQPGTIWWRVRRAARRWAVPVKPRTRPLLWRAKPGVLPDADK